MSVKYLVYTLLAVAVVTTRTWAQVPTIALIQYNADRHYADYDTNMKNLTELASKAILAGANILVLPEGSAIGYASSSRLWCRPGLETFHGRDCDDVSTIAEHIPNGRTTLYWESYAKSHNVTIFFNVIETDGSKFFNTTAGVDSKGLVGTYRKMQLYWVDQAYALPGKTPLIVDLYGARFGLLICMDANYDSMYQFYKSKGVTRLMIPMNWDQSASSDRAGRVFFQQMAKRHKLDLFVSDQSPWDSTGFYPSTGAARMRAPLADVAVDQDGFVIVGL